MAKIMRIVEPHLYEEFLSILRKPICSCTENNYKQEDTCPTVTAIQKPKQEEERPNQPTIVIPSDVSQSNVRQGDDEKLILGEMKSCDPPAIKQGEQHVDPQAEMIGSGRPANWLGIEMLRLQPYKEEGKIYKTAKDKRGKRRKVR